MSEGSDNRSEFIRKKVDESWKDTVQKEKTTEPGPAAAAEPPPAEFLTFISTLAMQALMALGEIAHPVTQEKQADLPQAQYLIDVLQMLSEKTQGNVTPQETDELNTLLYELRMKFVRKTQEAAR
jgi:hypothetical protein